MTKPTPQQQAAIDHGTGPCLVLAGAGTGKTRVITERIATLITKHQVEPERIVALTFTEKAAGEMQERVDMLLPYGTFGVTTATFHGYCNELLRRHSYVVGIDPNARLIAGGEQVALLRRNFERLPLSQLRPPYNPVPFLRNLISFVEQAKEERITPETLRTYASQLTQQATDDADKEKAEKYHELANCYEVVTTIFAEHHVLTYADLLVKSLELLQSSASALKEEQTRCQYLLIDEFQDTNTVQAELAYLLAGEQANIFVVGDDDQSIYRFRGANIANILTFQERFPQAPLITLTENFRSGQTILDAAYALIQHNNPHRLEAQANINKQLHANQPYPGQVEYHRYHTSFHEAEAVAERIQTLLSQEAGLAYRQIAILARSHNHLDAFERELLSLGIPTKRIKAGSFYSQPSVEAALSFLRFLQNPHQSGNLFYLLTHPPFELAIPELRDANVAARRASQTLWELLNQGGEWSSTLQETLTYLHEQLEGLSLSAPSDALRTHIQRSRWQERLYQAEESVAANHLNTLYHEIRAFEELNRPVVLSDYLRHIDDLRESREEVHVENEAQEDEDAIQLMTVHASKGLEFHTVFVVTMVNRRFPGADRSGPLAVPAELLGTPDDNVKYEEERRLAYVAFTRAQQNLILTSAERYAPKQLSKTSLFVMEALNLTNDPEVEQRELAQGLIHTPITSSKTQLFPFPKELSASALEAFEDNPADYQKQHLYKVLIDPEDSAAIDFGDCIHAVLRSYFTAQRSKSAFDIAECFERHWKGYGYENASQRDRAKQEGFEALERYLKALPPDFEPEAVELPVVLQLPEGVRVVGKIDRLDKNPDSSYRIIDYKTGRSAGNVKKNLPLAIYALALSQQGKTVQDINLHYLLRDEALSAPVTATFLKDAQERVNTLVENLREAHARGDFPDRSTRRR